MKQLTDTPRLIRDLIIVLLTALLIAFLIWKYFDYRITRLRMESHDLSTESMIQESPEITQIF